MKKLIYSAYEKADNALVGLANKGVKTWNWTTGKTKTDLAYLMQGAAPVFECTGMGLIHPFFLFIQIPYSISFSHEFQKKFKKQEELEQVASEKRAIPLELTKIEEMNKKGGPVCFVGGGVDMAIGHMYEMNLELSIVGTGLGLRGASHYIMRADPMPPRKNCLSRAKDKLVNLVKETRWRPSLQPEPAFEPVLLRDRDYLLKHQNY
jgi:hypothetical protein